MAIKKQPNYRLSGTNPLAYMGVEPSTPPQLMIESMNPTINDNRFNIGTIWTTRDPAPLTIWMLIDQSNPLPGNALWVQLYPGGGGGATSFPTNSGTATPAGGILNVFGTSPLTTSGSGNTVTVSLTNGSNGQVIIGGGAGPAWANITAGTGITITNGANSIEISATGGGGTTSFNADTGSAVPSGGVINVYGANVVSTFASGNTIHVGLTDGLNGQIPIASTGNPTEYANITSTGGTITVTNGPNTINLDVTASDASSFHTDSGIAVPSAGVLNIDGANLINTSGSGNTVQVALNESNNGYLPIGATGAPTVMAPLTAGTGISIVNGANSITISATGGGVSGFTFIGTQFFNNVSSVVFNSGYGFNFNNYLIIGQNLTTNNAVAPEQLPVQVSTDGGSTWLSLPTDYSGSSTAGLRFVNYVGTGGAANWVYASTMYLNNLASGTGTITALSQTYYWNGNTLSSTAGVQTPSNVVPTNIVVNALRFIPVGGIAGVVISGSITIWAVG